jgi:hypothetical protein
MFGLFIHSSCGADPLLDKEYAHDRNMRSRVLDMGVADLPILSLAHDRLIRRRYGQVSTQSKMISSLSGSPL